MKTLVCNRPGQLEYRNKKIPELKKGTAIIRIRRVGICGTDLHAFEGTQPYFEYPKILGHELAGELVAFDSAPGFKKGETVSFIPYFNCGICIACRTGKPNCCSKLQVFGVHIDGGLSEYIRIPSDYLLKAHGLTYEELALTEPLAIGAHGVNRALIKKNEFVLVIGAGPIGMGTMEFARIYGGQVIALDYNKARLAFCKEKLKIKHTIDASDNDISEQLSIITNGDMASVVIDATGNLQAINNAFQYMAHGGRYVLIGLQKEDICFSHPEFHKRESVLMSSRNATRPDFDLVISSIKTGQIDPNAYITHRFAFEKIKDEFKNLLLPGNKVIKAMVVLPDS